MWRRRVASRLNWEPNRRRATTEVKVIAGTMNTFFDRRWRQSLLQALFITSVVLGLFIYWFGIANRYVIFLYGHATVNVPQTQPFDEITTSRYWMAGLVGAGVVMVLYTTAYWVWGRVAAWRNQVVVPAPWWQVWLGSALPLSIGIPGITITMNSPTLPPRLAAACVVATLLGLAIALAPGAWAATRPCDLLWLLAYGCGLLPALLLLHAIELPGRGLSLSPTTAWVIALGGSLAGLLWLVGMSLLRRWRHKAIPSAGALLMAGLGLTYVLLPLVHYRLATPPDYHYISAASNFFAFTWEVQAVVLLVAISLALGVTAGRRRLIR